MADDEPEEEAAEPSDETPSSATERSRRTRLTPEHRRFLGPARSIHDPPPTSETPARSEPIAAPAKIVQATSREQEAELARTPRRRWKLSRAVEMQNVALIFGALFLLGMTFYFGKKYESLKYVFASRNDATLSAVDSNKFAGISAGDLVEQALAAERLGNWQDAADRFIAAKYKNLSYSGLLFRVGKLYYDHGDFDAADKVFARAIAFGENIDSANYYRGMIAVGRSDFPAAERFFEAATNAAPFNADYYYSLAETLRKDRRPQEAISRYEQAAARADEQETIVCQFKIRMTRVEANDVAPVSAELEKKQGAGSLPVDWIMTAAAIQIHAGNIDDAVRLVREARASDRSHLFGLFAACAGDRLFNSECQNHPELAKACQVGTAEAPTRP
jgi:tetratricopeptide (TPR) repeat protein